MDEPLLSLIHIQAKKVEHTLMELLVVAVCSVLAGADDFVKIEKWEKEKLDWFR
jgi:hypothetical protein